MATARTYRTASAVELHYEKQHRRTPAQPDDKAIRRRMPIRRRLHDRR